jgi:hypothetical protein
VAGVYRYDIYLAGAAGFMAADVAIGCRAEIVDAIVEFDTPVRKANVAGVYDPDQHVYYLAMFTNNTVGNEEFLVASLTVRHSANYVPTGGDAGLESGLWEKEKTIYKEPGWEPAASILTGRVRGDSYMALDRSGLTIGYPGEPVSAAIYDLAGRRLVARRLSGSRDLLFIDRRALSGRACVAVVDNGRERFVKKIVRDK